MFTGIISDVGEVIARDGGRFTIRSAYDPAGIALGASIAHDGCCLTVTSVKPEGRGCIFTVDVSNESLAKTTLKHWQAGRAINLERALKAGEELGGHIVTGHVDGVARIGAIHEDGQSRRFTFEVPADLARYIAGKGSVALDGTSLTVNKVDGARFDVLLIQHSLAVTTWGERQVDDRVNLEVDTMARYAARLAEAAEQLG